MSDYYFNFSPSIILDAQRCYECGRHWAFERGNQTAGSLICPNCGGDKVENARRSEQKSIRRANALAGALKRIKKLKP